MANDQQFTSYGAKLLTKKGPHDPYGKTGDPKDTAEYVVEPGVNFLRPWIAIRNGPAFQFPGGMEGFQVVIDPLLGIHKYIGDNKCVVDVLHAGEEHITLNGSFLGNSSPALFQALRQVVYQGAGEEGKIVYIPEIMTHAQRMQVVHFDSSRDSDGRGRDMSYTIELIRIGTIGDLITARALPEATQPIAAAKGAPTRFVKVDTKHNTLRKIARWKLGAASKWDNLYTVNEAYFVKHGISKSKAPDYRLPLGTKINY
jgi:hypothetical protein